MQVHLCHAIDCSERVDPKFLMCGPHWFTLPGSLRREVWRAYRPGQEIDKAPSQRWLDVARTAINFIAEKEGKKPLPETEEIIKTLESMLEKHARETASPDPIESIKDL